MTDGIRFSIESVFDLPQRAGLLASGTLTGGVVRAGTVLRDEATGDSVTVLGVEFETPADRRQGRTTLLIERTAATPVRQGRTLTG
jgi:hypothetical protein